MPRVTWYVQNEVTDAEGFYPEGAAAFEAEKAFLLGLGVPGAESLMAGEVVAIDRDEAHAMADVSDEFANWLEYEDILVDRED